MSPLAQESIHQTMSSSVQESISMTLPPPTPQPIQQTDEPIIIEIESEPPSPQKSPSPIIISPIQSTPKITRENTQKKSKPDQTPIIISNPQNINNIPILTSTLPTTSPIVLPANFMDLFSRPANLFNPTILRPLTQAIPVFQQLPNGARTVMQMPQQSPPVYLPANFGGTVLIQPTIHIHTSSKSFDLAKYCQIKPKEAGKDYSNQSVLKKKKN